MGSKRQVVRLTLEIDFDLGGWLAEACTWPPVPPPGYPAGAPWPPPGVQQEALDDVVDNLALDVAGWAVSTLQCQTIIEDSAARVRLLSAEEVAASTPQGPDEST